MIPKVQTNFQENYNNSFKAKLPDKKLVITCYDGKEVIVDKLNFDRYLGKNKKDNFLNSIKDILFEFFPNLDESYRKIMKTGKKV